MNPPTFKLGKLAPRHDPRTLSLARYLTALSPPPPTSDWSNTIGQLGMMGNDRLGDCTCAAMGHLVQSMTGAATGTPVIISDQDIIAAYEASCGYNPGDSSTDRGGIEIVVLNYWRNNGIGPAGHQISAYAAVNPKNPTEVMQAINLFGGIYVGVALPTSAQAQTGSLWDVTPASPGDAGSWGGHAIPIIAYDDEGLTCVTWGTLQKMTWAFFQAYCDEAYAIISHDWIEQDGKSPSGFDLATLQTDLAQITA